ncbi:class I SAM-dependent DNA methyltransferase [Lutimaribacter sp. EGI FJ00015]|uniref:Class I SAM-dependent DNA methyltransferase n=1 Tax=Lutimaribacter degradans TaxID=2945989 RepID=A0ACC5ZTX9_9RHOB|nr:DNA methyltransferase [Lutimaribacter sp. EGI FJ00013]MCM2561009.1 class I SAM-dependent DNA methyltransferase [Lutimaribacter sp. EGI FJ00013]MCO0612044.1 class I SAM-dependent DNA methyltransferase [Lutimaribacter sp. EGI FJ00015]MCO0634836.1 class I SAM-dependent DNA methyltransferase [Lutimaribacter sp. EGI FJ00014]
MQAADFIKKWEAAELKERSASQAHFLDLCALLGIEDPISADPKGDWFTFERGASKTSGGEGWADVWRKGCFAWEYKGKKKDLDKAFDQLLQYSIALENPPLLIVSDMTRIRIQTNWTNTVQQVHEITTPDLLDASKRDLLRACFTDPESLRPAKTRQALTEEAAQKFASLAQRLREREHDPETVAHFVNRLVFCMFAEDVDLLPNKMFQKMLELCQKDPTEFQPFAKDLFAAMQSGGRVGFEKVEWFNGGLFDDDTALPLEKEDLADLLAAAKLDWSEIDPSILGTLFERGLDPDKRSQLGAHYTDRDKIMQIVNPVVVEPLLAEWAEVKAQIEAALSKAESAKARSARTKAEKEAERLHAAFLERLRGFRVLDPACGSGNFLYLSLLALKDIEHRTNLEAEALGLPRGFPTIGPECVKGIELNPYAAELARVSVWVGEIQWMRRNGFDAARNPILRPLGTIENRDAVLAPEGSKADWPDADAVVGNPPFLGAYKMSIELGEDYVRQLRKAWPDVPGSADLVAYWFAKSWEQMNNGHLERAGLVSTNSIRGGASREVLKPIVAEGRIYSAFADESWTVEGAAVRVSMICFDDHHGQSPVTLNGTMTAEILSDLTGSTGYDLTDAKKIRENNGVCIRGIESGGPFELGHSDFVALATAPTNPNGLRNTEVLWPVLNGSNILKRAPERYLIDFSDHPDEMQASLFEGPYHRLQSQYSDYVAKSKRKVVVREKWWLHRRSGEALRRETKDLTRKIVTPRVGKYRVFVFVDASVLADSASFVIARDDYTTFGILHSRFHESWSLRLGTFLGVGNDPRYTASTTFETFPFPKGLTPDISATRYVDDPRAQKIAKAAAELNRLRENWLNPPDLVDRVPEVVEGYPDRLIPKDDKAAKELKKRTLTNLYNARPAWLDHAHKKLDEAVAEAYDWGDDWRDGKLTDDEILARLFRLNQERVAKQ